MRQPRFINSSKIVRASVQIFVIFLIGLSFVSNSYSACRRIVSLAPSITETLFYLGLGKNIIGVTRYAEWPKAVRKIAKIGGYYDPNIKLIVKLAPDILFLTYHQRQIISELKKLDINYKLLHFDTTGKLVDSVRAIGRICNRNDSANKVIKRMNKEMSAVKKLCSKGRKKTALIIMGNRFPITAAGNQTFMSQMLPLLSMKNAYSGKIAWPQIPLENIVQLNPDYLFIVSVEKGTAGSDLLSLLNIMAVKKKQIVYLTGQRYFIDSPRITEIFL
ncbi:MAG: ABC transporter substrate-binding protein, partial [Epsilonproteobacteria bacterium]|nr:ABC transporter substrate-binding protein [Campylobacterota bacterium]